MFVACVNVLEILGRTEKWIWTSMIDPLLKINLIDVKLLKKNKLFGQKHLCSVSWAAVVWT